MTRQSTAHHDAERNLLFSLLALHNNFIAPAAIVAAFHTWTRDKSPPMGQIFVDQGAIDQARRDLLEVLVELHIQDHGGDVEKSLAAVGLAGAARAGLEAISDPDLGASLAQVRDGRKPAAEATRTYSPTRTCGPASGSISSAVTPAADSARSSSPLMRSCTARSPSSRSRIAHADEPDSRSRFIVEAEITGGLEHPGIVPVYGLGHYDDGRPYYAMRFIRGESLREAIKQFHQAEGVGPRSRRALPRAAPVVAAIPRRLQRRGLRAQPRRAPSRPEAEQRHARTLRRNPGGRLGFGQGDRAYRRNGHERTLRPPSGSDVQATRAGVAVGTLSYMSPEQAAGRPQPAGAGQRRLQPGSNPLPRADRPRAVRW